MYHDTRNRPAQRARAATDSAVTRALSAARKPSRRSRRPALEGMKNV
jgi:hypothetical protein